MYIYISIGKGEKDGHLLKVLNLILERNFNLPSM